MNEDTRLFSSNNPIGRLWYFLNLIILAILTYAVHYGFLNYILPSATKSFSPVIHFILYIAYFIFAITYFKLIDRRLCSIFLTRDDENYRKVSGTLNLFISLLVLFVFIIGVMNFRSIEISPPLIMAVAGLTGIIGIFSFIIGFIPQVSDSKTK